MTSEAYSNHEMLTPIPDAYLLTFLHYDTVVAIDPRLSFESPPFITYTPLEAFFLPRQYKRLKYYLNCDPELMQTSAPAQKSFAILTTKIAEAFGTDIDTRRPELPPLSFIRNEIYDEPFSNLPVDSNLQILIASLPEELQYQLFDILGDFRDLDLLEHDRRQDIRNQQKMDLQKAAITGNPNRFRTIWQAQAADNSDKL